MDPQLARDGLFGSGIYLAEAAGKADQYMTVDRKWMGNKVEDQLYLLHSKLYHRNVKHAGTVFYALVCRVCLDAGQKP